jgi:hypothetical protein
MPRKPQLRAVAFKEGDVWVVHGLEYDIVAQTKDPLDAPLAFLKTLLSTMLTNRRLGRDYLANVRAAPDRFREMFENATVELTPTGPMPAVEDDLPRPNISLRAFRQPVGEAHG